MSDLAKIGIVFKSKGKILLEFVSQPNRRREVDGPVMAGSKINDRVDDELEIAVSHPDDRAQFDAKPGLPELRRDVAELKISAIKKIALRRVRSDEQCADFEGVR